MSDRGEARGRRIAALVKRLSEIRGASGDEGRVRAALREAVAGRADEVRTDPLGNLIVTRRARGGDERGGSSEGHNGAPSVMIAAHMDEIGLIVTRVTKSGLLQFKKVGGIDDRLLPSKVVRVGKDGICGVIGSKPIHLQEGGERSKVVSADDLYIDIGATSKEQAEKHAGPGNYATFASACGPFGEGLLKGKAFDDRAGCAILADLLNGDYPVTLHACFTVQEEIGLRGAQVAAYACNPDLGLVLEGTTCADLPGTEEHGYSTVLGGGPALTWIDASMLPHRGLVRHLAGLAERRGIPHQFKRVALGGTDGGRIHLSRAGVPTAVISVPCRYIHAPAAVLSYADLGHAADLAEAFLREPYFEGGQP